MTQYPTPAGTLTAEDSNVDGERALSPWRAASRGRLVRVVVILAVIGLLGVALTLMLRPAGPSSGAATSADGRATAYTEVTRQTLEARTNVDGTLEYDASTPLTTPVGTDASSLRQAQEAVTAAKTALNSDRVSLRDAARSSRQSVDSASTAVDVDRRALDSATSAQSTSCATPTSPECATAKQQVSSARDQLSQARAALASARAQGATANHQAQARVDADEEVLSSTQTALGQARRTAINPGATITAVAEVGSTIERGQQLYAVDGTSVPLFYGTVTPWRALYPGVSGGSDVAALNENLAALGYDSHLAGHRDFSSATERAVNVWKNDMHAAQDGTVALGEIVYRPGPIIVTAVTAARGQAPQPGGEVLTTSSTTRVVAVSLDTDRQGQVKVGDEVTVTLPGGATTRGTIAKVGTIATRASDADSGSGGSSSGSSGSSSNKATIEVQIKLGNPGKIGHLDQAPVQVAITTARQRDTLVVPLAALLARPGGAYAVEVVHNDGTHQLIDVNLGLVDDANSRVAVEGVGLAEGQKIVVPRV